MLLTAVYAAAAIPSALGPAIPSLDVAAATLILAIALIALSIIDLETLRLPNVITLPLILAGVLFSARQGGQSAIWTIGSAAVAFLGLYVLNLLYQALRGRTGIGLGDAKLFAAAGAWLGAENLPAVLLYACIGAMVALLVTRVRGHIVSARSALPFGPFLAGAIWLVWLYGPSS